MSHTTDTPLPIVVSSTYEVRLTDWVDWLGYPRTEPLLVCAKSRAAARACAERIWLPERTVVSIKNLRTGVVL